MASKRVRKIIDLSKFRFFKEYLENNYSERLEDAYVHIHSHIDRIEQENTNLKQVLIDIREYCKNNNEYWGNDDYINGKNEGIEEVQKDILQIINKALGGDE